MYPNTQRLIDAVMMDKFPSLATAVDFGIVDQKTYEFYYYPIRNGELTAGELDKNLGNGPGLTALLKKCPSNLNRDILITTAYDGWADEEEV